MSPLEAIILGIIQGLTEFLPVSSSGHLELGKAILGENKVPEEGLLFTIVVHAATACSTILIFWKDIVHLVKGVLKFEWNTETKFLVMVVISMIPVVIVGLLWEDELKALFDGRIGLVGMLLLVTAALLFVTHYARKQDGQVTNSKALIIGLAQAVAVLPGISRSGATIATSLLLGIDRSEAARFSFLMVLPPIFGAMTLQIMDYSGSSSTVSINYTPLIFGFIAAFISGAIACKWMIRIVKRSKLTHFGIYCAIAGAIAIIVSIV
jgi:undecaprenyl-diphosphatase